MGLKMPYDSPLAAIRGQLVRLPWGEIGSIPAGFKVVFNYLFLTLEARRARIASVSLCLAIVRGLGLPVFSLWGLGGLGGLGLPVFPGVPLLAASYTGSTLA